MVSPNGRPDILKKSDPDLIALSLSVETRFKDLLGSYLRIRGVELIPPKSLDQDMLRWREMAVRHRNGDLRNTDAEKKSVRAIAEWTIRVNCELRNQSPKVIVWKD